MKTPQVPAMPPGMTPLGVKPVSTPPLTDREKGILAFLKTFDLGLHKADDRGECLCSQCEVRLTTRQLIAELEAAMPVAPKVYSCGWFYAEEPIPPIVRKVIPHGKPILINLDGRYGYPVHSATVGSSVQLLADVATLEATKERMASREATDDPDVPVKRSSLIAAAQEHGNLIRAITGLLRVCNDCNLPSPEAEEIIQEAQIALDEAKAKERP